MTDTHLDRAEELLADVAWVRRLAAGLVGDPHLADDLAQEAWIVALQRRDPSAPQEPAGRRAFLFGVLRHLAAKARRGDGRRARREHAAAKDEGGSPTDALVERAALSRELVGLVTALDEPFRTTLLLRYLDELPPRAIARRTGVPVRTVASRLQRGLARLREELDRRPGGRATWLPGAFALGGSNLTRGGAIVGGIWMGAKVKTTVTAAAVVALAIGTRQVVELFAASEAPSIQLEETSTAIAAPEVVDGSTLRSASSDAARTAASSPDGETTVAIGSAGSLSVRGSVTNGGSTELGVEPAPTDGAQVRLWTSKTEEVLGNPRPAGEGPVLQGGFALEVPDPGYRPVYLYAAVEAEAGLRRGSGRSLIGVGAREGELEIVRLREGILAGVVRDEHGAPVEGVVVRGLPQDGAIGVVESVSDADGAFRLAPRGKLSRLDVADPDLVLLHADRPEQRENGGYEPVEIVVARGGRVICRAVDEGGAPIAGARVSVRLAPEETRDEPAGLGAPGPPARTAETDAAGVAELGAVWIGRRLLLSFRATGESATRSPNGITAALAPETTYDKVANGRLVRVDQEAGSALVVPESGVLEVQLSPPALLVVRGEVTLPDGSPAAKPSFELLDLGRDEWDRSRKLTSGVGDDDGRFDAILRADDARGRIAVVAIDGAINGFVSKKRTEHAARVEVDPADARLEDGARVLAVELALAETYSISGRLVDEAGEPLQQGFGNRVFAVPAGAASPYAPTALGREAMDWAKDGTFRIDGLPGGVYDLFATRELERSFFSFSTGFVRVPNVAAGTSGLEVRIARDGGVRVRFEIVADQPPEMAIVLVAAIQRRDGVPPPAGASPQIVASRVASWPRGATFNFAGGAMLDSPLGREQLALFGVDDIDGIAIPDLSEGWYRFGLQPKRGGELSHAAVATEPVYLRPGEHVVRFELTPVAPLAGRLTSDGTVAHLAVQVVDDDGRPVVQRSGAGLMAKNAIVTAVGADGSFRIPAVPVGRRTLRIGRPLQLERGEFVRELEVDVVAPREDDVPVEPLEIRL